jgi:hypothetical protein
VSAASAREGVIHSALPIPRRSRLQLSGVRYLQSLNRRAGLPVATLASAAAARSAASSAFNRAFCASRRQRTGPPAATVCAGKTVSIHTVGARRRETGMDGSPRSQNGQPLTALALNNQRRRRRP